MRIFKGAKEHQCTTAREQEQGSKEKLKKKGNVMIGFDCQHGWLWNQLRDTPLDIRIDIVTLCP